MRSTESSSNVRPQIYGLRTDTTVGQRVIAVSRLCTQLVLSSLRILLMSASIAMLLLSPQITATSCVNILHLGESARLIVNNSDRDHIPHLGQAKAAAS